MNEDSQTLLPRLYTMNMNPDGYQFAYILLFMITVQNAYMEDAASDENTWMISQRLVRQII